MTYQVNEIFDSVQGEGVHAGVACTFIRLQGCSVGCPWCDTKYTWKKGGSRMSPEEIVARVHHNIAIITGGEPTLWNLDELLEALWIRGIWAYMETSGQNELKGRYAPNWITWSPKENLHYDAPFSLRRLVDEVKFVVDDELPEDIVLQEEEWFAEHRSTHKNNISPKIVLMPEGCPPTEASMKRAFEWVMRHPRWRLCDRLQYRIGVR